jgi:hypothetical protein
MRGFKMSYEYYKQFDRREFVDYTEWLGVNLATQDDEEESSSDLTQKDAEGDCYTKRTSFCDLSYEYGISNRDFM